MNIYDIDRCDRARDKLERARRAYELALDEYMLAVSTLSDKAAAFVAPPKLNDEAVGGKGA